MEGFHNADGVDLLVSREGCQPHATTNVPPEANYSRVRRAVMLAVAFCLISLAELA